MKITQGNVQPKFEPITIILESLEEATAFKLIGNVATSVANAVLKDTRYYDVTSARHRGIKEVLYALWGAKVFQDLELGRRSKDA